MTSTDNRDIIRNIERKNCLRKRDSGYYPAAAQCFGATELAAVDNSSTDSLSLFRLSDKDDFVIIT